MYIARFREWSRLSIDMVLLSLAATQFDVSCAVYTNVAHVDQLVSINLHDGIDLEDQVLLLARIFTALADTFRDLTSYYYCLNSRLLPLSLESSALHLPTPTSAAHPFVSFAETLDLRFLYKVSRLNSLGVAPDNLSDWQENTRHTVFAALGGGIEGIPKDTEVIVKFVR
ncbi:hypothetical protein B0H17DRAFT_1282316 [Mycena rosella]|uniref:Uncharacterized protein n=1 Tax=Mycena rosella TaxID=1033263 RepID=A0AAD7MAE9_MYCRO|nr:hypothetical protein B0H17DRAFT_1282316 [Mycena rosella]